MEQVKSNIQTFEVGDIEVVKVLDLLESISPKVLYEDKARSAFDPHLDWLQPHFLDAKKSMLLSIHSFVIKTRHHNILVDTCIGNHKSDSGFPQWNDRNGNYLAELVAADCRPEDIDYVFCTHMHVDHTGWNTQLKDGRWVPTFPNAKYLFNEREWACWKDAESKHDRAVIEQNIMPIIEAGQVQWVDNEWSIDDQVSLVPTPGHTPGHCSVALTGGEKKAFITGDMMIHPVQIAEPQWQQSADNDKALAIKTRTGFVEDHCDRDIMILGTHFNTPTGVYIIEQKGQRRISF
ncbi:MAG: MBL fold metallo-hydrolase [Pseudomonadales bacterium]|nr:MBL fold metallo-hydrolase [Pseudomonadales bacterium]